MADETRRLDKWLWYARFFKSRSLATRFCASGRLRVNSETVTKAHFALRVGDVLTFPKGRDIRVVRVARLGTRRGPAAEAQALYDDLDPPTRKPRDPAEPARQALRERGQGRPTKRERRETDRLRGGGG